MNGSSRSKTGSSAADASSLSALEEEYARLDRGRGSVGAELHLAMRLEGVDDSRRLATGWLNAALTEADVEEIVAAFDRALGRLAASRTLRRPPSSWMSTPPGAGG